MTDPAGNNSKLGAGAPFSQPFPAVGIAAGALDSTGTNMVPLNLDAAGNLRVSTASGPGGGGNPAAATTGTTVPAYADYLGLNVAGNLRGWTGLNIVGTTYAGQADLSSFGGIVVNIGQQVMTASLPVVLASNQSNVTTVLGAALPAGTNAIGTVSITQALPSGTNAIGTVSALQSGNWSVLNLAGTAAIGTVSITQAIPAGTNAIGTVSVTQALPSGTNALGTVSALQSGNWSVLNLAGTAAIGTVSAIQTGTWTTSLAAGANAIGTVSVTGALPAGTNALGTVSITQAIPAGTNALGTVSAIQSGTWTAVVSAVATANMTTVTASSATTGAVTILAALATGTAIYVGSIQFSNSGTVASVVTLSDLAGSKFLVAGGGVSNVMFGVPLKTGTHSALTMTCSAVSTSVICNVQGWGGP